MPKVAKTLGANEVARLDTPGFHAVGGVSGLGLRLNAAGARSWVLRTVVSGIRRDMGLGSYPGVTLASAREKAREIKDQISRGIDPIASKRARNLQSVWTFQRCATEYIAMNKAKWGNAKSPQAWANTLSTYAFPVIGAMQVKDVQRADILRAIEPHWLTKTETMSRLRGRIEKVLAWATVKGYREGENPAIWRNNLALVLPPPRQVSETKNHQALPASEVPSLMKRLAGIDTQSARCLVFLILTAARSGEARGATWGEIDFDTGLWTIPAMRMKSRREHRVPLSQATVRLLERQPRLGNSDYIFAGEKSHALSDMALNQLLRRLELPAVPHGFRSTFVDWAHEKTTHSGEVVEMALAHKIKGKAEAAYRRGDLLEKRRALMEEWARHCHGQSGDKVFKLFHGIS
ncbi:MAG: tyrosine-type recombinase/integrase [Proteobacteria bacterium]|nr:tyrosine-type recombinase/integrase [Pseudomonadota bacterium]MDA0868840.1 tyrosine-type recombinase/integrase [Pseudomonadota bacterium]MDA1328576.1 tyrosine-type recombinase/integrase [Pseudomonadota bacterium]